MPDDPRLANIKTTPDNNAIEVEWSVLNDTVPDGILCIVRVYCALDGQKAGEGYSYCTYSEERTIAKDETRKIRFSRLHNGVSYVVIVRRLLTGGSFNDNESYLNSVYDDELSASCIPQETGENK